MTVASLNGHLEHNRPPVVQSCYDLAIRYRVSEDTARAALKAHGYVFSPETKSWVRQQTQLDRIEKLLIDVLIALKVHQ